VQPGDEVLVHAAAGGAGRLIVQMAKMRGGRVTATTSGGEKAELARSAGADEAIGYDEVPEGKFAVVYDGVGQATFDRSLAALRPRGMLVVLGAASGPVPPFEVTRLNAASTYLTRPGLGQYVATRDELLWRSAEVYGWVEEGKLDVRIGGRYPLKEARRAQEDLESRRTTGKLRRAPPGLHLRVRPRGPLRYPDGHAGIAVCRIEGDPPHRRIVQADSLPLNDEQELREHVLAVVECLAQTAQTG
jgi:NADPH:quinone reductase